MSTLNPTYGGDRERTTDLPLPESREGDPTLTHVLMPNMAYWCGGSILTKAGTFVVGVGGNWGQVTCPECRAGGKETIQAEIAAQQGRQQVVA